MSTTTPPKRTSKKKSPNVQTVQETESTELKLEKIKLLEQKIALKAGIPWKYGFKLYKWQREFIESDTPYTILNAGNQIGKSSALYIRMLQLASEPSLWPKYFPNRRPVQFWLCQPTRDIQLQEFRTKLVPEFLPKNGFENHTQYGWTAEFKNKQIYAIHINTGVSIYYRTYEQDISALMSGTVDAMFIDEECPWHLMPELQMRTKAPDSKAQFSISLTPVKGQEEWRQVIEVRGDGERLKDAKKLKVSVYDCKEYEDGTPSRWTEERINRMLNELGTENERRLRIFGEFVSQEGLVLSAFSREKNVEIPEPNLYKNSLWYSAVDPGGGGSGSLPGMVFLEVGNDFKSGKVRMSWRGTRGKVYTSSDIMDKYIELRAQRDMTGQYYDYSSKDFGTISERSGVGFEPADKSRDDGWALLNTLFKNQMLAIDNIPENTDLITEIVSYRHGMDKKKGTTLDHIIDALRYAAVKVPWDFTGITGERIIPNAPKKLPSIDQQRMGVLEEADLSAWSCDDDMDEFNDLLGV